MTDSNLTGRRISNRKTHVVDVVNGENLQCMWEVRSHLELLR